MSLEYPALADGFFTTENLGSPDEGVEILFFKPWLPPSEVKFNKVIESEGNGTPLQYSCLENPRDGGAWWAAIYGVAQSQTWLKRLSSSSSSSSSSNSRIRIGKDRDTQQPLINGLFNKRSIAVVQVCSTACGIFLNQGPNPGLLHWQIDSFEFPSWLRWYRICLQCRRPRFYP